MPVQLNSSGIDIFYIDESVGDRLYVVTSVQVPFLRFDQNGASYVWEDFLRGAKQWRSEISAARSLKARAELHAHKLLRLKGRLHGTGRALKAPEAVAVYEYALSTLGFLPNASIITAYATNTSRLYGATTIEAAITCLLQRIRKQCESLNIHGMIFFDEGHNEYINFFRRASKYLPTGSRFGAWQGGKATKNMPLNMFLKDANLKNSSYSFFVQIADLACYASLQKLRYECGLLPEDRIVLNHHLLYDKITKQTLNLKATYRRNDGIVKI